MDSNSYNDEFEILRKALIFGLNVLVMVNYLCDFNDALHEIDLYLSSVGDNDV